jgi:hypothetical protein
VKDVLHSWGKGAKEMRRKSARFQQRLESTHFAVVTLGITCSSARTNGSTSSQKEIGSVTWWQVQQGGSSVGRDNICSTYNTQTDTSNEITKDRKWPKGQIEGGRHE